MFIDTMTISRAFPESTIISMINHHVPVRNIEELSILPQAMLEDLEQVVALFKSHTIQNLLNYDGIYEALLDLW